MPNRWGSNRDGGFAGNGSGNGSGFVLNRLRGFRRKVTDVEEVAFLIGAEAGVVLFGRVELDQFCEGLISRGLDNLHEAFPEGALGNGGQNFVCFSCCGGSGVWSGGRDDQSGGSGVWSGSRDDRGCGSGG